ncbi:MAG: molybdopterin-dependent oxidoreductase, partial [Dehalococcoidia bacterium]|nr:molybdopterin-dependent oxidoreductase [Dehalococcoidia bacterium]
ATEAVGWSGRKRLLGSGKGLGLACSIHVSGAATAGYDGSYARVTIGTDGKATLVCGEGEIGQGASTVLSQIAAEELGLSLADVTITGVDTDSSPFSLGAWATRVTTVAGNAVRQAASEARKKLLEEASEVLEARAEDLETVSGRVQVRGVPAKGTTYGEVARRALFRKGGDAIVGEGVFQTGISQPSPAAGFYGNFSIAYGFAAQAAEVEVDRETGNVNLTRLACAHDVGKAINPMSVEGQIEGGVVQGIGYALGEEVLWENGDVANATLGDYRTPTSVDVPLLPVSLVESPDPRGPFGAKGIGEPTIVPTAPAIANAVCNAVGVRIKDLPLTPQKVLSAIRRREGEETASPGE